MSSLFVNKLDKLTIFDNAKWNESSSIHIIYYR
jgi:hypothetical protein